MPLSFAQAPQNIAELTRSRIQDLATQHHLTVAPLVAANPSAIQMDSAHPVYNLGLREIVAGIPLGGVNVNSWRFLVRESSNQAAAAETLTAGRAGQPEFASVNAGPFVQGTEAAVRALQSDPAFAQGDWEVRLLRVPALHTFAVWAHSKAGSDDRFKPVEPVQPFLDANRTYSWTELLAAMKPAAEQKLSTDDGLRG